MFNVLVYANMVRGNQFLANWTPYVSQLRFASEAWGGHADASFTLKLPFENLRDIVLGTTAFPTYVTNRVRITDNTGFICYEGEIYDLVLRYGAATLSRTASELYTVCRFDYTAQTASGTQDRIAAADGAAVRALYGNRVYMEDLSEVFADTDTRPATIATKFFNQHRRPGPSDRRQLGGRGGPEIALEVSCMGLADELNRRYAFNNSATTQATAEIVRDMIRAGTVTSGTNSGNGQNGWHERLTATGGSNNIPYAAQFLSTRFGQINSSGVSVSRSIVANKTRMEVIRAAAAYGSSNSKRMLFQVWADTTAGYDGLGQAYFLEQPTSRVGESGYSGYTDDSRYGYVWNANNQRIPAHQVRAGQWIGSVDRAAATYGTVSDAYDDPRMFWIERAEYDADNYALSLSSSQDWNPERYIGELIKGKRVIRAQEQ